MPPSHSTDPTDYLCVDAFLRSAVDARALASAFELGLVDHLSKNGPSTLGEIQQALGGLSDGLGLLGGLLVASRVVEERDGRVGLTHAFRHALRYRDLLEAKLDFVRVVLPDFVDRFTVLLTDPDRFQRDARIFDLFSYGRCFDPTPANYELTTRWVQITTALTRYEAQVLTRHYDFGRHRRMLDIGGNSGELALQVCRRHPGVVATVLDLPLVCQIGRAHVRSEPERDRITFVEGNALADALPGPFDLVAFKSMLHDWPERDAMRLIGNAADALSPGGVLLIFERGPLELGAAAPPYSMIPFLLFWRSYRSPAAYRDRLEELGFEGIAVLRIDLEMPFYLVTGRKAEA